MTHVFRRSATSAAALLLLLSVPVSAVAQGLSGRPGVDYYPPWMLDADPRVSGGGQDYRIWDDRRFDRRDEEFLEIQRRQRRDLGPGYSDSPEYREEQIGRAHACTPVTNAHLECRLLLENKTPCQTDNITCKFRHERAAS